MVCMYIGFLLYEINEKIEIQRPIRAVFPEPAVFLQMYSTETTSE